MTIWFRNINKDKWWDYFILIARFLLGWTFLHYGYGKLSGFQFGISEADMARPIAELTLQEVGWYLFDHEPFSTFVGVSQIACGILLIINRTALLGAFLFLPIVTNILVIDWTIMPPSQSFGFTWRLSAYILLDLIIIWHYKKRLISILNAILNKITTRYNHRVWWYIALPVMAIGLDLIVAMPQFLFFLITDPVYTINQLPETFFLIGEWISSLL